MTTADNDLLKQLIHPAVYQIIEDAEGVDDAVQSLEYLRDEISKVIDMLQSPNWKAA